MCIFFIKIILLVVLLKLNVENSTAGLQSLSHTWYWMDTEIPPGLVE